LLCCLGGGVCEETGEGFEIEEEDAKNSYANGFILFARL
jgi:hypothetical protein